MEINTAYAGQCTSDLKIAYDQANAAQCTTIISELQGLTLVPGIYMYICICINELCTYF